METVEFKVSGTLRVSAGELDYREAGSGRPVIFLHGLVANSLAWRHVVHAMSTEARCIAPDWPLGAHRVALPDADLTLPGLSHMVVEAMDSLGLDEAVLVGNGYGGDIAQVVAATHPQRVQALVLVAMNTFDADPWPTRALRWLSAPPGAGRLQALLMRRKVFQRLPITYGWVAKRPIPDDVMAAYLTPLWTDAMVRRDFHRFLRSVSPHDLTAASAALSAFDRPALIVWPGDERVFSIDGARRLAATMPRVRWVTIDDSYSWVPEDQPLALATELRTFLRDDASR